jgi:O-antigen/teichoic acid export membrane protein
LNLSQITGSILYQVLPLLVALVVAPRLPGLVIAAICGRLVSAVMLLGFCIRHVPARGRPRTSRAQARAMLGYGGWVTVTGLIYPLLTVFDRFVIGAVAGMGAVAAYTIPFNLVTRIATLPASFQNALFPRFAALDPAEASALQARATRLVACMMTPLLVVGLLLLQPFMTFWIGPGLSLRAAPVGQILILGLWFSTLGFVPFSFLQSRGRPDVPAKLHVLELVIYAPALFYLTRHFGVAGAACAWGARNLADTVLLFAAVRLLRGFCAAWPGLLLLFATYALTVVAVAPALYAAAGAALAAASLFWALRALPPEIVATLRAKFKTRGRRPAVAG